ncbi:MAG: beta-lactamase family protein [Candidatus Sumerlaeia bacterium]|nr:beta-lactamase family protein [Candidatus Sumerlaeia bacterium]
MVLFFAPVSGFGAPEQRLSQSAASEAIHFPLPGQGVEKWKRCPPAEAGFKPEVIAELREFILKNPDARGAAKKPRWALWRNGCLVHVEGDFNQTVNVASLRKTWFALAVGAAIHQGKIPSLDEKISKYLPELKGNDAEATWRHVITQSAGFDYPYGNYPDFKPGEMWTYSDYNPIHLCNALARIYGRKDYHDDFAGVMKTAYFDAIGMEGWKTAFVKDSGSGMEDGVRLILNLDHMGRLGLLVLARGKWNGQQLVAREFVEQLETKQTAGMRVNYHGPNDGQIGLDRYGDRFEECPYGFMTWTNSDGNFFPRADKAWAWASGAGGAKTLWNHKNGVVFAGVGVSMEPSSLSIPHIIEENLTRP